MGGSGIRILFEDPAKFFLCAGKLARPQAALGEHLVKLCIGRIRLRHRLEKLRRKVKFAFAVVAQSEQGLGLTFVDRWPGPREVRLPPQGRRPV